MENEFEKTLPKDKAENLRKLNVPDNERIRQIERNYAHRHRGACQAVGNIRKSNEEEIIEMLSQPTRKRKTQARLHAENKVKKTGKPHVCDWGLFNPVKLNISSSTLNSIKGV